jgi:hypothetical protein
VRPAVLGCPCLLRRVGCFRCSMLSVELGWEASSSRNVFLAPLFFDDLFKVERLRFFTRVSSAMPVYCDFVWGSR